MGIFDFMKGAGEKIFKPGEARREAAIKEHLGGHGGDYAGVAVDLDNDACVIAAMAAQVFLDRGFPARFARLEDLLACALHEIENAHGLSPGWGDREGVTPA